MSDNNIVMTNVTFGSVEIHNAPPRVEGRWLYLRGRTIEKDQDGNVTRDETYDTGLRVENWEECAHLFGIEAPPRKTWWQRICDAVYR